MINFTKKELIQIRDNCDHSIKNKINKYLKSKEIDHTYTRFIDPNGKFSKKFKTSEEARLSVEKIIGKWASKTANKWSEYEFIDVEYGNESTYTY